MKGKTKTICEHLDQKTNTTLKTTFVILPIITSSDDDPVVSTTSPEYYFSGLTLFQLKINVTSAVNNVILYDVLIRFVKLLQDDDFTYKLTISSEEMSVFENIYLCDDSSWRLIHNFAINKEREEITLLKSIDISVVADVVVSPCLFAPLQEDVKSTDFQLRGIDGSVDVHKLVLASTSPVLRTMLSGEWKETAEGVLVVLGTTKKTLEHLRDYMYSHKLPDTGLEDLLSLASCYMMKDLVQLCAVKLLGTVSDDNILDLMQLACKYKLKKLLCGILGDVKSGVFKVNTMHRLCIANDWI